jgi:hypothetical protein
MTSPAALALGLAYINARLKKVGPENSGGGVSISGPVRSPGEGEGSSVVSVSDGAISCLEYLLSELRKHAESKDVSCKAGTFLSEQPNSLKSASYCGPTKQPPVSHLSLVATNELQSDGSLASLNRRSASFTRSTLKSSANTCGND